MLYTEVLVLANLGPLTLSFSTSNVIVAEPEKFFKTWKKKNQNTPIRDALCAVTCLLQGVNRAASSQTENCIKD